MDIEKKELMKEIVSRVINKLEAMGEFDEDKKCESCSSQNKNLTTNKGEEIYNKRLLSEKDMIEYNKAEKKRIVYSKRTIVTDVAREYAKKFKIELIEECLAK